MRLHCPAQVANSYHKMVPSYSAHLMVRHNLHDKRSCSYLPDGIPAALIRNPSKPQWCSTPLHQLFFSPLLTISSDIQSVLAQIQWSNYSSRSSFMLVVN